MDQHDNEAHQITAAAESTKEQKMVDKEWTEDWLKNLDDITQVDLTLGTVALLGITFTDFQSLDGRDKCDAGPEFVKMILKNGGVALMLLIFSCIAAICTKTIGRALKNKNKEKLKNRVLRYGALLCVAIGAAGFFLLGIFFAGVYEVRLGVRGCGGLTTTMTTSFWAWGGFGTSSILVAFFFAVFWG